MKYAQYICKLCKKELSEQDEFCPDCGKEGKKIIIAG
jgi:rRNA maturation endonuclease Nob1